MSGWLILLILAVWVVVSWLTAGAFSRTVATREASELDGFPDPTPHPRHPNEPEPEEGTHGATS